MPAEKKSKKDPAGKRERSRSRRRQKKSRKDKDKETPHFRWEKGMTLGPSGRYVVQKHLGDGTFGRVLACVDTQTKDTVAVKVVKGVKRYCEHAEAEAEILDEIQRLDTSRQSLCVELRDSFLHPRHHYCLVFEPLGTSIRDFLKANDDLGLYLEDAREMARQLLQGLAFLHGVGLTHTDLKCRNVMLRDAGFSLAPHPRESGAETRRPHSCQIALIDFGGAVFADERHSGRIGTRQFRAPEVVMGLRWDEAADLWSAGCIVAMLYTGERPFSVHEDMEHLAMMEKVLEAQIPAAMAKQAVSRDSLPEGVVFTEDGRLAWPSQAPEREAVERVEDLQPLREQVLDRHRPFFEVVRGLLEVDPAHRLAAAAALKAAFFSGEPLPE